MTSSAPKDDDRNNTSIEEIISLAVWKRRIDLLSVGDDVSTSEMDAFKKAHDGLDAVGLLMVLAAAKLLEGNAHSMSSDNPDTITRFRSLAEHMGADIHEIHVGSWLTKIVLHPPSRQ
jgi:hypothetical protein